MKIYELQAFDILLKYLLKSERFPLHGHRLNLVIKVNGDYWYGDLVPLNDQKIQQKTISDNGDIDSISIKLQKNSGFEIARKTLGSYAELAYNQSFFSNPFFSISDLPLLFDSIWKVVEHAAIEEDDSPIYPYLFNAKTLDNRLKLPFLNLKNQEVQVVSIIDVTEGV